jgi:predicted nucleotidyltransferase
MNLGQPLSDVVPGVRGALLAELVARQVPVTRRALAAAAGVASGYANSVVDDLVAAGLVTQQVAGRAYLVQLNRKHVMASALVELASARRHLVDLLTHRLSQWPDLEGACLFGSVARGEADRQSDIDVMVIVNDRDSLALHDRMGALAHEVNEFTGNYLQLVEYTPSSWQALVGSNNPLVAEIRRDAIPLTPNFRQFLKRPRKRATP